MHNDSSALLWFLADVSLRAGAVALAAAVVLKILDVRAASVRHTVWTTVLAAMVLMPVLPSIMPALPMPAPPGARLRQPLNALRRPNRRTSQRPAGATPGAAIAPLGAITQVAVEPVYQAAEQPRGAMWPASAIAAVYAAGFMFFLVRLVLGWRLVARVGRAGRGATRR